MPTKKASEYERQEAPSPPDPDTKQDPEGALDAVLSILGPYPNERPDPDASLKALEQRMQSQTPTRTGAQTMQSESTRNTSTLFPDVPPLLDDEARWIVRHHGKDTGPFSEQELHGMLCRGEVAPETLLLHATSFARNRLQDVRTFQPYLHLHNSQNPILLEEQARQQRDQHWQEVGRRRLWASLTAMTGALAAFAFVWQVWFVTPEDIYLSDDGQKLAIALGTFRAASLKKKKTYKWKDQVRRQRAKSGRKGKKSPSGQAIDFTKSGAGNAIPRASINRLISKQIKRTYPCFLAQIKRDGQFRGGVLLFRVLGHTGRVGSVSLEEGQLRLLTKCVSRVARGWQFPRFQGNAEIYIPVRLGRRRRY